MASSDKLPSAGKHYRYKKLVFWPQGGIICIDDTRDGSFTACTRAEFFARVITINEVVKQDRHKYADERNEDMTFVENGLAVIKEAKRQGDPFDPKVLEELLRHRKRSYVFTGDGKAVTLHTASMDEAPEQAKLPPLPKPSHNRPPLPSKEF